jgi:hypothetical protein
MTAELRWNRLVIATDSEQEFLQAVRDYFPQLLQLPYSQVELDITGSTDITEDAFRSIAIRLVGGEASDKKMRIRIPPAVDRYFRHANLYRMVDIEVIGTLSSNGKTGGEVVKANIQAGRYDLKATSKLPSADAPPEEARTGAGPQERAPTAVLKADRPMTTQVAHLLDVESGAKHEIQDRLIVGREAPSDLIFQIPTISKRHFLIRRISTGFAIEDLRSTNGTYLNGLPVHEPVALRDGDEIVVAITMKHPKGARVFQFTTQN